jgi:regulator of RNase E activity RraA
MNTEHEECTEPPEFLALRQVSTATITSQLLRRGFRNTFLSGLQAQRPDLRMVGRAFTLRYVPAREDLAFEVDYDNRTNVQRLAVESIGPGEVLVIDARGNEAAASFGHIIATRIWKRGAAGLVTDGPLRDRPAFAQLELPSYCRGSHATTSSVAHHPVDLNIPIACGGVLIMPGDVLVGDAEGVVAIPAAVVADVAADSLEQEEIEGFSLELVRSGESILEVYPLSEERRLDFVKWKESQGLTFATRRKSSGDGRRTGQSPTG